MPHSHDVAPNEPQPVFDGGDGRDGDLGDSARPGRIARTITAETHERGGVEGERGAGSE